MISQIILVMNNGIPAAEPEPEDILMGDTVVLWGDEEITFED